MYQCSTGKDYIQDICHEIAGTIGTIKMSESQTGVENRKTLKT